MKEITRIHLAKTPYSVEIDAKKQLEKYVHDIERVMRADAEAMQEIEARMVELLAARKIEKDGVISKEDVAALRTQMGEPKEFSEDGVEPKEEVEVAEKPQKRLMRNPDSAIFGGVCAGIGAYFGINAWWIRILAIISPFISMGTAIIIYIVLWIVMPPARTATEKLQMAGKPVTLDALQRFSQDDESRIGKDSAVAKLFRAALGTVALMVAVGALLATIVGGVLGFSIVNWMDDFQAQSWAVGLLVSLIVGGTALAALAALMAHSAFRWSVKKAVGLAMVVVLVIGTLSTAGMALFGMQTAQELVRDEQRLTTTVPLELPRDMEGVKYVGTEQNTIAEVVDRDGPIRAKLRYFNKDNQQPPKVTFHKDSDTLQVSVDQEQLAEECPVWFMAKGSNCFKVPPRVLIYGPLEYAGFGDEN